MDTMIIMSPNYTPRRKNSKWQNEKLFNSLKILIHDTIIILYYNVLSKGKSAFKELFTQAVTVYTLTKNFSVFSV